MTESLLYTVWLSNAIGFSSTAFTALLSCYSSPKEIYLEQSYSGLNISESVLEALRDKSVAQAFEILNSCEKENYSIVTYFDAEYPKRLKRMQSPPVLLYYIGKLPSLENIMTVGIVGTREPTEKYFEIAGKYASVMAKNDVAVISGLAKGIDGASHKGALSENGITVGVSGVEIGVIYPKENAAIYEEMYKNGVVISEYPPGAYLGKYSFPRRDRIISALSDGVFVCSAARKSGSIITADVTFEMGKKVFVYNDTGEENIGAYELTQRGAIAVSSPFEILAVLSKENTVLPPITNFEVKPSPPAKTVEEKSESTLSESERKIYGCVPQYGKITVDEILKNTDMECSEVMALITMLEIYGLITSVPGGIERKKK